MESENLEPPVVEPLVARLAPDPDQSPGLIAIDGYLGDGTEGNWRLYSDLSFTNWLDVPRESVRYHTREEAWPAAVTILWVDREAAITFAPSVAELLSGELTGEHLRSAFQSGELTAEDLLDDTLEVFDGGGGPSAPTGLYCGPGGGGRTCRHLKRTRCA